MIEIPFPAEEYRSRVEKVRSAMADARFDVLLIFGSRQWYRDHYIHYIGNYDLPGRPSLIVLPLEDEPVLIIGDEWDLERARQKTWISDVRSGTDLPAAVVNALQSHMSGKCSVGVAGGEALGYSGLEAFPSDIYSAIKERFPKVEVRSASQIMDEIRAIRSHREIDLLRQAAFISDLGAEVFYRTVREGISERELWTEIWYAMQSAGAQDLHVSMSRGPGSFWLHPPSGARLSKGDVLAIELSPRLHGYFSQANKMCIVGSMTREWRELCRMAMEVRDSAIDLIRPGVIACDIVEKVAKQVAGFALGTMDIGGAYRLGHGCGPSLDEWPSLNSLSRTVLREGMGLAVHPIIYVPYLHSLFMLGEYVLVTENGHEVLTKRQTEILTI